MRVVVPHMGNLYVALRAVFEELSVKYVIPPLNSDHTLNLGVSNSPEMVCLPFKTVLGNWIEGLEAGGDTLIFTEARGICRLGYYFRIQRQVLEALGYKFSAVTIKEHSFGALMGMMKELSPASLLKRIGALRFGMAKLKVMDNLERLTHKIRPREKIRGTTTTIYRKGIKAVDDASTMADLKMTERDYTEKMLGINTNGTEPLRIGVMGEFFVVLDQFSNLNVEIELGKLGCEVERTLFISKWTNFAFFLNPFGITDTKLLHRAAMPYLKSDVGGDGWESVGERVLRTGELDGLIHLLPFGCLPEITAQNIMKRMKDKIPVLHIPLDEQTGRAGLLTRLEAFTDMLRRGKAKQQSRRQLHPPLRSP